MGGEKEIPLKSLSLPETMSLTVRVDLLNLLDSQQPISFVKEDIPIFGEVWGRQQPRQARVTVRLRW